VIGAIQATETIKLILGIGSPLIGRLLIYDALHMSFDYVKLKKNPECKICGEHPEVTGLIDYFEFCGVPGIGHEEGAVEKWAEITAAELAERLKSGQPVCLLDVREPHELAISSLPGAVNLPLGQLAGRMSELDPTQEIVIFCKSGIRSARALEILLSAGFRKVRHLKGGINAWASAIDPRMPVY
jgi:adenylyltransferase/sulfurtransferase